MKYFLKKEVENKTKKEIAVLFLIFTVFFLTNIQSANAGFFGDLKKEIVNKIQNTWSDLSSTSDTVNTEISYTTLAKDEDFVLVSNSKNIIEKDNVMNMTKILDDEGVINSSVGPLRSSTEEEIRSTDNIQVYEVKTGDTLSEIAKLYDVSKNTIVWANDIKGGAVTPGDILIILPVDGVKHVVKKGDTVKSIAKKYDADYADTLAFNSLTENDTVKVGDTIIIPDGEMTIDAPVAKKKEENKKTITKKKTYTSAGSGYYTRPVSGGIKTQGLHGQNAIDIGIPVGSSLYAAAAGTVQAAKGSGYNGGYGQMIIITHDNGTQTVYGHLNAVYVSPGQRVVKGENIGTTGNTGRSTGPHLHFEIRGATNPF